MSNRKAKMQARLQQKSRAMNLKYASDDLRRDRKVVITACLNHKGALVYCLDEKLKEELTGLSRDALQVSLRTVPAPSPSLGNQVVEVVALICGGPFRGCWRLRTKTCCQRRRRP